MRTDRPPFYKTAVVATCLSALGAAGSVGVLIRHTQPVLSITGDPNVAFQGDTPDYPRALPVVGLVKAPNPADYPAVLKALGLPEQDWAKNDKGRLAIAHEGRELVRQDHPLPVLTYTTPGSAEVTAAPMLVSTEDAEGEKSEAVNTEQAEVAVSVGADLPVGHSRDDGHDHGDPTPEETAAVGNARELIRLTGGDPNQWAFRATGIVNGFTVTAWPRIGGDAIPADEVTASVSVVNGTVIAARLPMLGVTSLGSVDIPSPTDTFQAIKHHRVAADVERGTYSDAVFGWAALANPDELGDFVVTPVWTYTGPDGQRITVSVDPDKRNWPTA